MLPDIGNGRPPPALPYGCLHAAHTFAAHRGLIGEGLDPVRGEHVPVVLLAERLRERAAPGLAATGLRRSGGGAARQCAAYLRRGRLTDVAGELARTTAAA